MAYEIDYFHPRVLAAIETWPVDVLSDYARLLELLIDHGQVFDCRTPVRWEAGSLNFDPVGDRESDARFTAFWSADG